MGFNAGKVVEVLDWDFTDMAGATPEDKGIIPSPSQEVCDLFQARYWGLMEELSKARVNLPPEKPLDGEKKDIVAEANRILAESRRPISERIDEWRARTEEPDKNSQLINDEIIRILADACSGSPTEAQIRLLGSRELQAFVQFVNEQFSAPKFNFAAKP